MTAHDKNSADIPTPRTATAPDIPVTHANRDKATVIVWRITADTVDDANTTGHSDTTCDSPLTPRLARHLVAIYSDVHSTVLDFDADIHLQRAAEATGRTYSTITDTADPGPRTPLSGPTTLILLRWPRPGSETAASDASSLLSRCQRHLTDGGSIIVVVTAAQPSTDGANYRDAERVLLAAAQTAELRHLHDIVPIETIEGRDAFTYATDQRAASPTGAGTPRHNAATTLVVFGHPGRRP